MLKVLLEVSIECDDDMCEKLRRLIKKNMRELKARLRRAILEFLLEKQLEEVRRA